GAAGKDSGGEEGRERRGSRAGGVFAGRGRGKDEPGGDAGTRAGVVRRKSAADGHDIAWAAAVLLWRKRAEAGRGAHVFATGGKRGCADSPAELRSAGQGRRSGSTGVARRGTDKKRAGDAAGAGGFVAFSSVGAAAGGAHEFDCDGADGAGYEFSDQPEYGGALLCGGDGCEWEAGASAVCAERI